MVVVNTCGFIDAAVEESLDTIEQALGSNGRVIVTGCLGAQAERLRTRFPTLLDVSGPQATDAVVAAVHAHAPLAGTPAVDLEALMGPAGIKLTPPHYAYLKISEGCNHTCSFCIIPSMRGKLRSRLIDDVLAEAQRLADSGVQEVMVIAQDTSALRRRPALPLGHPRRPHAAHGPGDPVPRARHDHSLGAAPLRLPVSPCGPPGAADGGRSAAAVPGRAAAARGPADPEGHAPSGGGGEHAGAAAPLAGDLPRHHRSQAPSSSAFPGRPTRHFGRLLDFLEEAELDRVGCFTYSNVDGARAQALPDQVEPRRHAGPPGAAHGAAGRDQRGEAGPPGGSAASRCWSTRPGRTA